VHVEYNKPVELVVFDLAGTLVDGPADMSEQYPKDDGLGVKVPVIAFDEVLSEYGINLSWDRIRIPMGFDKKTHLRELLAMTDVSQQFESAHGREWTDTDVEKMYDHLRDTLAETVVCEGLSDVIGGVLPTLAKLKRQGKKLAITTGYGTEAAEALLESLQMRQGVTFDATTHSDAVPNGRPRPWMVYEVMKSLDIYPPAGVVKVGDTVKDIDEGNNAGAWTVGVYETGNDDFESLRNAGADFLIPSVGELPSVISQIENQNT
jgi:phosphonoacetaldehyde hydrolase